METLGKIRGDMWGPNDAESTHLVEAPLAQHMKISDKIGGDTLGPKGAKSTLSVARAEQISSADQQHKLLMTYL